MTDAKTIQAAIRNRTGVHINGLTAEDLNAAGCMYIVAPIPDDYATRRRYLGDMLAQMCMGHKAMDDRLRAALHTISAALSYLLNSASYRDGELHAFDAQELSRKLRVLARGEDI